VPLIIKKFNDSETFSSITINQTHLDFQKKKMFPKNILFVLLLTLKMVPKYSNVINNRHYTDLNNVRYSGVQGVPCTSEKLSLPTSSTQKNPKT